MVNILRKKIVLLALAPAVLLAGGIHGRQAARAEGDWEVTPESQEALDRGLAWLARSQGPAGNWESDDLGLVATGALAFLAAGHLPGREPYGDTVERALDYVLDNAQPSGLLNIADPHRAMYNHGLSTFVLGQAFGMSDDPRLGPTLDRALALIAQTQALDGGWNYEAQRRPQGHDLSLVVMQALALRSAVDSGFEVPPDVVERAIRVVREHYTPQGCPLTAPEAEQRKHPGQFTYQPGSKPTAAMAAAGVVCLQEFGEYDDWRIEKSTAAVADSFRWHVRMDNVRAHGHVPFNDAYTLYYVAQAIYQVGGEPWQSLYPRLRNTLVASQIRDPQRPDLDGSWPVWGRVRGRPGQLYMTSVACFVLAIPNRYLPILQTGTRPHERP
jgi:hypothetical protein